jgi:hypothetical protein
MSIDTHGAGFILFDKNVPRNEIAEFMHQLQAWLYTLDWIDLHMRDAGGETVMAYRVDFKNSRPNMHEQFHYKILGELKSRFGEDADKTPKGVKRWSMSNVLESAT